MTDFDVLIVGGGPVGLAAAIEARMNDLSVAIVEPKLGAVDKACGEGLMPGALPLLARLGVEVTGHELTGVCYQDSKRSVTHEFQDRHGLGVRRTELHSALAKRAHEVGVNFIHDAMTAIDSQAESVSLTLKSGNRVSSKYLLGADGLHSAVARVMGLTKPAKARSTPRFGIRQHFNVAPWSSLIQVYFTKTAEVYITPVSDSQIGVAILGPRNTDFVATIKSIPDLARRIDFNDPASARMGAGSFPQITTARRLHRVLLIGDASGYVDAITGEGLRLGFAQAQAAIDCIKRDRPQDFEGKWHRVSRDFRWLTGALAWVATSPLRALIVPLAASQPRLFGWIVERLAM
jgi:flavin-dependent dehydrogenase